MAHVVDVTLKSADAARARGRQHHRRSATTSRTEACLALHETRGVGAPVVGLRAMPGVAPLMNSTLFPRPGQDFFARKASVATPLRGSPAPSLRAKPLPEARKRTQCPSRYYLMNVPCI